MENYKTFKTQLVVASDAPIEHVIEMKEFQAILIQLNYGTGTNTVAKLQTSADFKPAIGTTPESGNWVDMTDSSQILDNSGGVHGWELIKSIGPWLKVVVDGDAETCEVWISATRKG